MNPANGATPGTSTAHKPKPCSSKCSSICLASASLSSRFSTPEKYSMTRASALSAANGCRSAGRHRRRISRSVRSSRAISGLRRYASPPATRRRTLPMSTGSMGSQYYVRPEKLSETLDAVDARHRCRKALDQPVIRRIDDQRLAVPDGQRHFGGCSLFAGQRNDRGTREHVDVIAGQVVRALRPAERQVRVDRELDELVRVTSFRRPTIAFAGTGNDPDRNPSSTRRPGKRAADGRHHAATATGEQVHSEICERFPDRARVLVVLKRA